MPVYAYKAMDMDSTPAAGTIIADTPRQARDTLRERGLAITQISQIEESRKRTVLLHRSRRSSGEVVALVRELATLLHAGIPLLNALQTLTRQHRGRFHAVVQQLTDHVAAGLSLADAMERLGDHFDEMSISIVRVGENTGSLETALKRLADFKEKAHRLRSRITTALIYPAVVCLIGVAVSIFLMTYVVPNLLSTLQQSGKDLPAVTRAVKGISDLLLHWWWLMLLAAAGIVAGATAILRTEQGRRTADRLLLKVPILGELIRKENTSRMAVVLEALLRSGLPFVTALQITRQTVRNRIYQEALVEYEHAVTAGRDVAAPLEASGVFSPMVIQMLAVGQQAGQLEDMLQQLAEAFEQQVATAAARLTAVLEPLLIVLLAVMVGFIAFATILPILEASNVL